MLFSTITAVFGGFKNPMIAPHTATSSTKDQSKPNKVADNMVPKLIGTPTKKRGIQSPVKSSTKITKAGSSSDEAMEASGSKEVVTSTDLDDPDFESLIFRPPKATGLLEERDYIKILTNIKASVKDYKTLDIQSEITFKILLNHATYNSIGERQKFGEWIKKNVKSIIKDGRPIEHNCHLCKPKQALEDITDIMDHFETKHFGSVKCAIVNADDSTRCDFLAKSSTEFIQHFIDEHFFLRVMYACRNVWGDQKSG